MKYLVLVLTLITAAAVVASAAETRMYYSNGNYNASTSFGGTWHPGTLFKPTGGQYPMLLKTGWYGFGSASVSVQMKIWSATGSTVGSLLASFPATTKAWPTWTDVDFTSANVVVSADNFFLSTNNPGGGALGSSFRGSGIPGNYPGYHYYSQNDTSWVSWTTTDWAIECTVDTNYSSVQPSSLGRVKALYR